MAEFGDMNRTRLITAAAILAFAATIVMSSAAARGQTAHPQPAGPPAKFLAHIVRLLAANRYTEAWPSLNPLQQAIAPLQTYTACESQSPIPGHLIALRILAVHHEPASVLPDQPPVASTAVTFAFRIAGAPVPGGVRIVLRAHAVAVGPRWTWIMPLARLQL
jgi:hypothetical protein